MTTEELSDNKVSDFSFSFGSGAPNNIPSIDFAEFVEDYPSMDGISFDLFPNNTEALKKTEKPKKATKKTPPRKKKPARKPSKLGQQLKSTRAKRPRRIIPENKEYIPTNQKPTDLDVVSGRGGRSNHHIGNRRYFSKVLQLRSEYRDCGNGMKKAKIAQSIVDFVQNSNGRFLQLEDKTKRWFVLPNRVALDKAKQALRDKYVPIWANEAASLEVQRQEAEENQEQTSQETASTSPTTTQTAPSDDDAEPEVSPSSECSMDFSLNTLLPASFGSLNLEQPLLYKYGSVGSSSGISFQNLLQEPVFSIGTSTNFLNKNCFGVPTTKSTDKSSTNWDEIYQEGISLGVSNFEQV